MIGGEKHSGVGEIGLQNCRSSEIGLEVKLEEVKNTDHGEGTLKLGNMDVFGIPTAKLLLPSSCST